MNVNLRDLPDKTDEAGAFMAKMRRAAQVGITAADITGIVQAQVAKARAGDPAAIKFVFDRVIGGLGMDGATIVQENHYHVHEGDAPVLIERVPDEPLPPGVDGPDREARVEAIRRRLEAGQDPVTPRDAPQDPEGDSAAGMRR